MLFTFTFTTTSLPCHCTLLGWTLVKGGPEDPGLILNAIRSSSSSHCLCLARFWLTLWRLCHQDVPGEDPWWSLPISHPPHALLSPTLTLPELISEQGPGSVHTCIDSNLLFRSEPSHLDSVSRQGSGDNRGVYGEEGPDSDLTQSKQAGQHTDRWKHTALCNFARGHVEQGSHLPCSGHLKTSPVPFPYHPAGAISAKWAEPQLHPKRTEGIEQELSSRIQSPLGRTRTLRQQKPHVAPARLHDAGDYGASTQQAEELIEAKQIPFICLRVRGQCK